MRLHRMTLGAAARGALMVAILTTSLAVSPAPAQESGDLRAVLITGTSTGIGARMTEVLSQNGFFVYAGARKPADLERLD